MTKVQKIKVGDKVRSFDFDCKELDTINSCFVEGVVENIEGHPMSGDGEYLKFKISRKIFGGKEIPQTIGDYNWVPQNGQMTWLGKVTDNVVKI